MPTHTIAVALVLVLAATIGCQRDDPAATSRSVQMPGSDWREELTFWIANDEAQFDGLRESSATILARDGKPTLIVWTAGFMLGSRSWTGGGSRSRSNKSGTLYGRRHLSIDNQTVEWEALLSDDGAKSFAFNGVLYDLSKGRLFVATIAQEEIQVTQCATDISHLRITHLPKSELTKTGKGSGIVVSQPAIDANCAVLEGLLETDKVLRGLFTISEKGT